MMIITMVEKRDHGMPLSMNNADLSWLFQGDFFFYVGKRKGRRRGLLLSFFEKKHKAQRKKKKKKKDYLMTQKTKKRIPIFL